MKNLKNCPFCGSQVSWCGEYPGDEQHECHQISCNGCGVQFDVNNHDAKDAETLDELRQVMADLWNSRANVEKQKPAKPHRKLEQFKDY